MSYRAAITVIVALIVGVLAVGGAVGTPTAEAQTQTPAVPDTVPQEWVDAYKKTVRATSSPDPVKRSASRRILTRSIAKVGGSRFLGAGTRLGLAGAAVGTWAVVGYELKYISELGEQGSFDTNLKLAPATGAVYGSGVNSDGSDGGMTLMNRVSWSVSSDGSQYTSRYGYSQYVAGWTKSARAVDCNWKAAVGVLTGEGFAYAGGYLSYKTPTCESPAPDPPVTGERSAVNGTFDPARVYQYRVGDIAQSGSVTYKYGPELCETPGCSFTKYFPTVQLGPSTLPESQLSPDYSTTAAEGNQVIQEVVTDPEAPTVIPDAPPDWDDLPDPPEDPQYDPEAPENDPDPDEPAWDPDPYGDPASPLYDPTAPQSDPDEDGEPNETDPDDDNDGIPDEDDPDPYTPTDPTTLPDDHPYADPDGDGEPNKSDPDDDGDGVPDTDDPAPYDPTIPKDDPTFDGDDDGVPFKIDPDDNDPSTPPEYTKTDTDGDGSPDTYDPSPDDPAEPEGGPGGNPDGDGVPNRHDPFPLNPTYPQGSPDGDLDQDGTPNRYDPDSYRKTEPQGGPNGDPDQDGTPNAQDPAPNDEKEPSTQRGGACPLAPPRPEIDTPDGEHYSSLFPFNLFILAVDTISALGADPQAPPLPVLFPEAQEGYEAFTLSEFDSQAALARTIFSVAGTIGACWMLYKMVSQSKEGE